MGAAQSRWTDCPIITPQQCLVNTGICLFAFHTSSSWCTMYSDFQKWHLVQLWFLKRGSNTRGRMNWCFVLKTYFVLHAVQNFTIKVNGKLQQRFLTEFSSFNLKGLIFFTSYSVRSDLHVNSGYTLWQLQIHSSGKITLDPHFNSSGSVFCNSRCTYQEL